MTLRRQSVESTGSSLFLSFVITVLFNFRSAFKKKTILFIDSLNDRDQKKERKRVDSDSISFDKY